MAVNCFILLFENRATFEGLADGSRFLLRYDFLRTCGRSSSPRDEAFMRSLPPLFLENFRRKCSLFKEEVLPFQNIEERF